MTTGLGGSRFTTAGLDGAFGIRVVAIGDVTGDGRADLAVSAVLQAVAGNPRAGAVYVIHGSGSAAGYPATITLDLQPGPAPDVAYSVITGGAAFDLAGVGLAAAGDLNNDGRADLLISAPGDEGTDGRAFAIYTPTGGMPATIDLGNLAAGSATRFTAGTGMNIGASVAGLGDVNGDGFYDLCVTSSGDGRAYVLLGDGAAHPGTLNVSGSPDDQRIQFIGVDRYAGSAGDLNGDGIGDMVFARNAAAGGGLVVVFGTSTLAGTTVDLGTFRLGGANGFAIAADTAGIGVPISPGDIDGDGVSDLLVQDAAGAVLIRGHKGDFDPMVNPAALRPGQGTRFYGTSGVLDMGGPGDINGAGLRDLVLVDGPGGGGSLYVVFGRSGGLPDGIRLMTLDGTNGYRIDGPDADDAIQAAQLVDLNGDGFADIAAGLFERNDRAGELAILYGGPRRLAALDGADGAIDGHIDLSFIGRTLTFAEADPVPTSGGTERDNPTAGSDNLIGTDGSDVVDLLAGNDTYAALSGDDIIRGGEGTDLVYAANGNDRVFGGSGADRLEGMAGDDYLNGGTGIDWMVGGIGNDTLCVDSSADVVIEQRFGGTDWLFAAISRTLPREMENLRLTGSSAIAGRGNGSGNTMLGNAAANRLDGLGGGDTLVGGSGADTLTGGAGKDRLVGGHDQAADRFVFSAAADSSAGRYRDIVVGFERGHDKLDLRLLDADAGRAGVQDLGFHRRLPHAHGLWFLETVQGLRVFADTTGDLRPEFEIRMDDIFRLTSADLML